MNKIKGEKKYKIKITFLFVLSKMMKKISVFQ